MLSAGLLASAGCGGNNGTLSLQLTDAPPDLASMSAALITVDDIDVHLAGAGDEQATDAGEKKDGDKEDRGWVTLARTPETFDLLKLQNDAVAALGDFELPEGKITQIRLHIDTGGVNEIHLQDGQVCALDVRNVSSEGVKINHPFKALDVKEGHRTWAVVDLDLKESVSQDAACTFRLNPVIKLKSSKME
jgi:hypothetical protein